MLPPWPPLDLTQEIDFAHYGIPAYRPKHPSRNVPTITRRHDLGHDDLRASARGITPYLHAE